MTSSDEPVAGSESASSPASPTGTNASDRLRCGPLVGCLAALLGGILTWGILYAVFPVFEIPERFRTLPIPLPPALGVEADLARTMATRWNTTLAFAILAAATAGLLAVAEAVTRGGGARAWWRGLLSGMVAGTLGAVAGLAACLLLEAPQALSAISPLAQTISVQCLGLGVLGLSVGLGVGIHGGWRLLGNAALGGGLGGVLVALLYPAGMGYLQPSAQTEHVMPVERTSQLIWVLAVSLLIALVITSLGSKTPAPSPAAGEG